MKKITLVLIVLTFGFLCRAQLNVPFTTAPVIDGVIDANDPWGSTWISMDAYGLNSTTSNLSSKFQIAYDASNIYLVVVTDDATPHNEALAIPNSYERDCSEVFFSMHTPSGDVPEPYLVDNGDWQIRFQRASETGNYIDGSNNAQAAADKFGYAVKDIGTTYVQEMSFPISVLKENGNFDGINFRFDLQAADNTTGASGGRTQQQFWNSNTDNQWNDVSAFGAAKLENPLATYSVTFNITNGVTGITGATVKLDGYNEVITDVNGVALISGVIPAKSIAYTIKKDSYEDAVGTIAVINSDVIENLTMRHSNQIVHVPLVNAPVLDGIVDGNDPWGSNWISLEAYGLNSTTSALTSKFQIAHDANNIYLVVVTDDATPHSEASIANSYERDCSEIYFSMHTPSGDVPEPYLTDNGDWQIRFQRADENGNYIDGSSNVAAVYNQFGYAVKDIGTTYVQEMSFPISVLKESGDFDGKNFRFDIQAADNTTGAAAGRTQQQFWNCN